MLNIDSIHDWLNVNAIRKGLNPLSISQNIEEYSLEMVSNSNNGDYWRHPDLNWVGHYDKTADVPRLLLSG